MKKPLRIVITGAASQIGKALKEKLPSSALKHAEVKMLDDDILDGTLTEYDGGVELIRTMTIDAFEGMDLAFFCSAPERSAEYIALVQQHFADAAPKIFDLSGGVAPLLTGALPRSAPSQLPKSIGIPDALATGLAHTLDICAALSPVDFVQATAFLPVSIFGEKGVDSLQNQFVELANFGELSKELFERQLMFNLVPSHGAVAASGISDYESKIVAQVRELLDQPAFPLHLFAALAPVFYSIAVVMTVKFTTAVEYSRLRRAFEHVHGIALETRVSKNKPLGGPLEATGRDELIISRLSEIPGTPSAFAFWFNLDNVTTGAVSQAILLAERSCADDLA